uniref:General transcription factor IIIC, polypeptide 2, beta n=1 Tax=Cyprinus carpio TaxID=7962 RepID=A0A8C1JH72_CYPCA
MAAAALKLGEQKGEKMGLPCEKDTDDQSAQINHESKGATQDSGEVLDSSEPQRISEGPPGVDQENPVNTEGTQKKQGPKEKTPAGRRRKEIVPQTPPQHDNSAASDTPELTSSGRPKRRAAKVALDYLYKLAKDLGAPSESSTKDTSKSGEVDDTDKKKKTPRRRGVKRKIPDYESDLDDDEDFSPGKNEEAESEDEEEEDSEPDVSLNVERRLSRPSIRCLLPNGLANNVMESVWNCFNRTKKFLLHSLTLRFMKHYKCILKCNLLQSSVFESLPHHSERWDALFFVGGPVRSLEWCPCPDGAATRQYAAIYCHKGMDDEHKINKLHAGPVLLQLWEIGDLQCTSRPSTAPHLAYALAIDDGCIWNIRWCPAGVWEMPSTSRKAPQMPRLGVLAAAFSNGSIGVYSLPHPEALAAHHQSKGETSQAPLICRVKKVLTLKMGSNRSDHKGQSGLCFAMDWLHVKPHNLLAAGFYDGLVGLWDLASKSTLLKVRSPDGGVSLYPYHCFHAHDENIRTLCWCRASSNLLVTVGDDRMAKMWDVRKSYVPLLAVKRCLSPEVYWPLFWSGILMAQECCFATFGQHGVHYFDSGYLGIKPYFVCPRKATVWSLSMSDWINTFAIADNGGNSLFSLLPELDIDPSSVRRRRYSVYRTDMVQFEPAQRPGDEEDEEEEVENAASNPRKEPLSYKGAIGKYYLHFHDLDLGTFAKSENRPMMKHLHQHEVKGVAKVDQMPLSALYKVRFNPNMDAYNWILSGGQSGLVRVNCARGLSCSVMLKQLHEAQAQFSAMFQSQEPDDSATAVHHSTADTVLVH